MILFLVIGSIWARPPKLEYQIPPCELLYSYHVIMSEELINVSDAPKADLDLYGLMVLKPEQTKFKLESQGYQVRHDKSEAMSPGYVAKPDSLGVVDLLTDGRRVLEAGPSPLWSAMGSFPGMSVFWPTLPEHRSDTALWVFRLFMRDPAHGIEEEKAKLLMGSYSQPLVRPVDVSAEVNFAGWSGLDEHEIARIESNWTVNFKDARGIQFPGENEFHVESVVEQKSDFHGVHQITRDGILQWARVEGETEANSSIGKQGSEARRMSQKHLVQAELRLLSSCGTETMEDFKVAHPAEKALDLYEQFVKRLKSGDTSGAVSLLDPKILENHSSQEIRKILTNHVKRYGIKSLGDLEIARDLEVEGDYSRFCLIGRAHGVISKEGMIVHIVVKVIEKDDQLKISFLGIDYINHAYEESNYGVLKISTNDLTSNLL